MSPRSTRANIRESGKDLFINETEKMLSAIEPGPWDDEPDRVEFQHVGFPCLILRNR